MWKKIEGYPNYSVSSEGHVRNDATGLLLKVNVNSWGYCRVWLSNEGKRKEFKLHRLVASEFIPNSESKTQVNHIDCDKLNNCVLNLEWVTPSENIRHASDNGLYSDRVGERTGNSKLKDCDILKIRKSNLTVKELSSIFKVNIGTIYRILKRDTWKHI